MVQFLWVYVLLLLLLFLLSYITDYKGASRCITTIFLNVFLSIDTFFAFTLIVQGFSFIPSDHHCPDRFESGLLLCSLVSTQISISVRLILLCLNTFLFCGEVIAQFIFNWNRNIVHRFRVELVPQKLVTLTNFDFEWIVFSFLLCIRSSHGF